MIEKQVHGWVRGQGKLKEKERERESERERERERERRGRERERERETEREKQREREREGLVGRRGQKEKEYNEGKKISHLGGKSEGNSIQK